MNRSGSVRYSGTPSMLKGVHAVNPPKSANRSGKSTPTKGKSLKEEERLLQDEEEQRLKAEQEEKERIATEERRQLELERLEALNAIREQEEPETEEELEKFLEVIEKVDEDIRIYADWNRYMKCDGKPDPTSVTEINTYIALCKERGSHDITVVLEEAKLTLVLINELEDILAKTGEYLSPDSISTYKQTINSLEELLQYRYNAATLKLLKEATYEADSETGNLQKVVKGDSETMMLWGNLNKNPRFKSYEFENEKFQFELPKALAMADISVRVLQTKYDHYSHHSSSFLPKVKKIEEAPITITEEITIPEDVKEPEVVGEDTEKEDMDDNKSTATGDGRKSGMSNVSNKDEAEEAPSPKPAETVPQDRADKIEEEGDFDEILDPDVVDLRQFSPLGGVYHIDLLKTPPQPKVVQGWTLTQIIDQPLTEVKYPMDTPPGKPLSRVPSAVADGREEGATPAKTPLEQSQPPIGITMKLPYDVMFFEEPQVSIWDDAEKHWKTSGITDLNFDEQNHQLSFKTNEFGIFSLAQDAHLNMPFQSWELRPKGVDMSVLTITGAIAEAEIEIKGTECRLAPPSEAAPPRMSHIYKKWMTPLNLIDAMKKAGVNLFPADDASKYVSIQEKEVNMSRVYQQMAVLSSAFAFSWSKWNNDAPKDRVVFQAAPFFVTNNPNDLDNVPDEDWATYAVGNDRCYKLALTEFEDVYKDTIAPNSNYHCDVIHSLRLTTSVRGDTEGKTMTNLRERSANADPFYINTVFTLLKNTKLISFS